MRYHLNHPDSDSNVSTLFLCPRKSITLFASLMLLAMVLLTPRVSCADTIDIGYFESSANEAYGSYQQQDYSYSPTRQAAPRHKDSSAKISSSEKKKEIKSEPIVTKKEEIKQDASSKDNSTSQNKAKETSKTNEKASDTKEESSKSEQASVSKKTAEKPASESQAKQLEQSSNKKDSKGGESTNPKLSTKLQQAESVVSSIGSKSKKGLQTIISVPKKILGKAMSFRMTGQTEYGMASYYGEPWHGRKTANGEIYDMYSMTAAHKNLPFGTHVKVTNLRNGRDCIVRINNRGPFVRGRIIDLSHAAARQLGMMGAGVSRVKLDILRRHN